MVKNNYALFGIEFLDASDIARIKNAIITNINIKGSSVIIISILNTQSFLLML